MKRTIHALIGFALMAYLTSPVYAFSPASAPILSSAAVTPNVMVLIDNSGSMDEIIWREGYNDSLTYSSIEACTSTNSTGNCNGWGAVAATSSYRPNNFLRANCASNNQRRFRLPSSSNSTCVTIYDPVGGNNTRYKGNYLRYLVRNSVPNNELINDYRMNVAREVTKSIVETNRGLRWGLFSFNTNNNTAGGALLRDVKDFSETINTRGQSVTTQAQADTNLASFKTAVGGLTSSTWTPLAEAYYEITRYFRGMSRYQGSGSGDYTSPIQYRCQRNFGIVVTDGLPTYDRTFPSNDPLRDNPRVAGGNNLPNWDGINDDGANLNGDNEGDTLYLDDIAKFAFDVDLRNTTANDEAGKSFNDPAFPKQNMFTYTVGFAVNNTMLQRAAEYGNGIFSSANNSSQLTASLTAAINEISAKAGSGGAGASSSATLTTETFYYKTLYNPEDWRGTIEAYRLNASSGRPVSSTPAWTTDTTITPSNNGARYETFAPADGSGRVVTLNYANLSAEQQAAITLAAPQNVSGSDLIAWAKGGSNTRLRSRTVLLGDVINSSLERASRDEQLAASNDPSYGQFLQNKRRSMTSSLLVNANDGFFHVIDAATGSHRYGYMPSSILPKLPIIADPDYASGGYHSFLVDGQISVADVELGAGWSTVALSGMGAGGKSLFAVKLFDGDNDIEALWEVSPPEHNTPGHTWNDLGYSYSKPVIARTANGRWVALFGNGYGSHQGRAVLYMIDVATGELVRSIVADANTSGTAAEMSSGNGLSSPQVVVDATGTIQSIYAGDLRGNMWKFSPEGSVRKLFAAGTGHPITVAPLVAEHEQGGHMVLFGTGKLSENADKLDKTRQAFYGIWDKPQHADIVTSTHLLAHSITSEVTLSGETYFRTTTDEPDWSRHLGWYLPLVYNNVAQGERVIYPALTTLGRVVFVTAKVDAQDPCESSGSGRLVELDLLTGSMLSKPVLDTNNDGLINDNDEQVAGIIINDGLPGLPVIVDRGTEKTSQTKIILLSTGNTKFIDERAREASGSRRIMWRQLQ